MQRRPGSSPKTRYQKLFGSQTDFAVVSGTGQSSQAHRHGSVDDEAQNLYRQISYHTEKHIKKLLHQIEFSPISRLVFILDMSRICPKFVQNCPKSRFWSGLYKPVNLEAKRRKGRSNNCSRASLECLRRIQTEVES